MIPGMNVMSLGGIPRKVTTSEVARCASKAFNDAREAFLV